MVTMQSLAAMGVPPAAYELGHIRGLEQQHYTNSKDNVYLEDGNLVIKATNRKTEDQYEVTQGDTTRKVINDYPLPKNQ